MRVLIASALLCMTNAALAADPAALHGAWTAVEAERDGVAAPELIGHRLELGGTAFTISSPDGRLLYGGTYTVDPAAQPAAIDFRQDEGLAKGQTWEGIYRLDGDRLTIVDDAPDPARGRPDAFAAPVGSGRVLLTFAR
jgi:uncharacterized protein (TIGR03067 family)